MAITSAEILRRPYGRTVMPETDGTFRAEIIEFPGCIAVGDTAVEALESLEDVATSWLEVALSKKQAIPAPIENAEGFSGKLVLRLPKSLHKKAAHMAAREGVSLNQFLLSSLSEQIGGKIVGANIRQRFAAMFFGSSHNMGTADLTISRGTALTALPLPSFATGSRSLVAITGFTNA
jgi:predicted RNase H-like HicB family nuclease